MSFIKSWNQMFDFSCKTMDFGWVQVPADGFKHQTEVNGFICPWGSNLEYYVSLKNEVIEDKERKSSSWQES